MEDIKNIIVRETDTILDVLRIIDKNSKQIAIVADNENKLLGTLSDGDIRRALLKQKTLNDTIKDIYYKTPTVCNINSSREDIIKICKSKKIRQIPILDSKGCVIGLEVLDELIGKQKKTNTLVIMAGGLGKRLRPLTAKTPKPMLHVGNKPILETIIRKFAEYGYTKVLMCVNYKSEMIKNHFEDGSKFGINIEYVFEDQRMGTAGSLSLAKDKLNEPFFVMNGDLITNINFEQLYNFHVSNNSIATMCVREHNYNVPYGVVNIEKTKIISIEEKPTKNFFINAGIYMLNPEVVEYIPQNKFYDMPTLFQNLVNKKKNVISFPLREYWLDIGRLEEYVKANQEYGQLF